MSVRSITSLSVGSMKMSMASKPIRFVCSRPNLVGRFAWTQAELIRPSFIIRDPEFVTIGCGASWSRFGF
jgi:hypothetical protein